MNLKLLLVLSTIWFCNFGFIDLSKFNDISTYASYLDANQFSYSEDLNLISILRTGIFFKLLEVVNSIAGDVYLTLLIFKLIPLLIIYFSLRKYDIPLYVLILFLTPVYIDLVNSQLRNSLAASIVIFGYVSSNSVGRLLGFMLGSIIHLSSYVLIFVYYLLKVIKNLNNKIFLITIISLSTVILINAPLIIFELLDDERFHIYFKDNIDIDKGYFLFSLLLIIISYKNYNKKNEHSCVLLVFAFIIFELVLTGGYYTRYMALFWPLVVLSLKDAKPTSPEFLLIFLYSTYSFFTNYLL
jgi:hypothetical protein